jgi:hypothetical protein
LNRVCIGRLVFGICQQSPKALQALNIDLFLEFMPTFSDDGSEPPVAPINGTGDVVS